MSRLLKAAAALLCAGGLTAFASTSAATATITDLDGQTWNNGTFTATIVAPGGGTPTIAGAPVTPIVVSGSMSSTGVISATLTDTSSVQQSGTTYRFKLCPNASDPGNGNTNCVTVSGVSVTGASPSLTTALSTNLKGPRFPAGPGSFGYLDAEVTPNPPNGSTYWNTGTVCGGPSLRQLSQAGWQCGGSGGGTTLPSNLTAVATDASGNAGQATSAGLQSAIGSNVYASVAMPTGAQCGFVYAGQAGTTFNSTIGSFTTTLGSGVLTSTGIYESGTSNSTFQAGCLSGARTILVFYTTDAAKLSNSNNQYGYVVGNGTTAGQGLNIYPNMPGQGMYALGFGTVGDNRNPANGTQAACVVLSATTSHIYQNGKSPVSVYPTGAASGAWTSAADNKFGQNAGGGFGWSGTVHAIYSWPAELTLAQCAQATRAGYSVLADYGVTPGPDTNWNLALVISDGDSINQGLGNNFSWLVGIPSQAIVSLGESVNFANLAIQGDSLGNQNTNTYATKVHPLLQKTQMAQRIVTENAGTNDIASGTTAATLLTSIQGYCTKVHSDNGKCVVSTILPRGTFNVTQDGYRTTYNAGLLPLVQSGVIDSIDDRAIEPVMGNIANVANATYYPDQVHPTSVGAPRLVPGQALAIHRALHPDKPYWFKINYIPVAFTGMAATAETLPLVQLMPNEKVCGVTARVNTAFAGTAVTALTMSVGDSTGTATQYTTALNLLAVGNQAVGDGTFASTNGIVQANFTATGGNMSAITAGNMDISVCLVTQQ